MLDFDCVTSKREMSDLLNNCTHLSRLQFEFSTIEDIFSKTVKFVAIVKQYVYHEQSTDAEKPNDVAIFSAETRTLGFLHSEMFNCEFHDYTLMCNLLCSCAS